MKKQKYDEDSIQVQEGLDGVRKRPAMYLGSRETMVFAMLREIVDNSIDESLSGNNDFIYVSSEGKRGKQRFVVIDHGRGIPVGTHKKTGKSTLETILCTLHAGGKFDDKSYKASRGLHGVGSSVTNALSNLFEVWTFRDGSWYFMSFSKGKVSCNLKKVAFPSWAKQANPKKGTIIRFVPDYDAIKSNNEVTEEELHSWLNEVAQLNCIKIKVKTDSGTKTYHNELGPKQFLLDMIKSKNVTTIGKPLIIDTENLSLAIQWSDYPEEAILSYVNGSITQEHGTHVTGLYNAITKVFKKLASARMSWGASEIRIGIVGFIHYKCSDSEYDSQTKNKLVTKSAVTLVSDLVERYLQRFVDSNKNTVKLILKRAQDLKKAKDEAKKLTSAASSLKKNTKIQLPGKLKSCSKKTPVESRELFIVEGDSAGGSAGDARNPEYQAVLALRGKPINAAKAKLAKVLENNEVKNIISSLGVDPKDLFNPAKKKEYNYGKVILLCDADEDGWHISLLLLTMFQVLFPDLIKRGLVYIVDAPLFFANYRDTKYYGYSLNEIKEKLPKNFSGKITRAKGWGEVDYPILKEIAFDEKSRKLFKVLPSAGRELARFMRLVGVETSERKKLLGV